MATLSKERISSLHKAISDDSKDINRRLFLLKFDYAFMLNKPQSPECASFAVKALDLYDAGLSGNPACPEAALLAALVLLRAAASTNKPEFATQAVLLLEACRKRFQEYYPFLVLLVQIQRMLGTVSCAMDNFAKLSVKNLQWETVGHLILTRISTIHPFQSGTGEGSFNPLAALDLGLTMFENADHSLVRSIHDGLKSGSYSNIINSVGMKSDMENSLNRQVYTIDERKIARFAKVPGDQGLCARPANLVDKRDFSFLPKYGECDNAVQQYLQCGPIPKEPWLDAMAFYDHLVSCLKYEVASQGGLAVKEMHLLAAGANRLPDTVSNELTEIEYKNHLCHTLLYQAVDAAFDHPDHEKKPNPQETFDQSLDKMCDWLSEAIQTYAPDTPDTSLPGPDDHFIVLHDIKLPSWRYMHTSFTLLETLQALSLFLTAQSKNQKPKKTNANPTTAVPSKGQITKLQDLVTHAEKAVHADAKRLKQQINTSGVLGKLLDVSLGRGDGGDDELAAQLERVCDEAQAETVCGRMKEAWEDALDGILAVKVGVNLNPNVKGGR